MSKRIFIIFGNHKYKSGTSFNEAVREEFIKAAKELGHEIDLINVYEEKQIKFWDGSPADKYEQIVNYRKRIEGSDVIFIMSPCHNFFTKFLTLAICLSKIFLGILGSTSYIRKYSTFAPHKCLKTIF